jgi:hypothetical protein
VQQGGIEREEETHVESTEKPVASGDALRDHIWCSTNFRRGELRKNRETNRWTN